ncbi:S41 family peptidase [Silvimonas sp.]|uniref:S41 family peptidase n=1 Tax=Silvimonas sp. TaxID=2650811 RepID=UPI002841F7D6|nr:S41 family peptidase [Silvimonas sp.]MDR3430201.1 S41 family peptidase [Silvimonas sp.]
MSFSISQNRPNWLALLHKLLLVAAITALTGCAVLDPHRIVSRQVDRLTVSSTLDAHNREAAFNQVWQTINDGYVDPHFNGVDWVAVRERYRPLVLNAPDDATFWAELDQMAGELNDVHTRVETPARYAQIKHDKAAGLGIGVALLDGQLVIDGVGGQTQAALLGVRSGQVLTGIDGQPALDWWQQQLAHVRGGSTSWSRDAYVLRALNNPLPATQRMLELERPDKSAFSASLRDEQIKAPPWLLSHTLTGNIAYLRFSGFDRDIKSDIMTALDQAQTAQGIVLDLRSNGGGDGLMALDILARFVTGEVKGARVITRDGKPVRLLGYPLLETEPVLQGSAHPLTAPLAILINRHSASAAELTAGAAQAIGRARVFGEVSCGCLLGFFDYDPLPGGGALAYSEVDMLLPNGQRIEGRGVQPDEPVKVTRQTLSQGSDPVLHAALDWLQQQKHPAASVQKTR